MSIFGTLLQVAGLGLGAYSSYAQSEAAKDQGRDQAAEVKSSAEFNKNLSLYDASVAEEEALRIVYRTNVAVKNQMKQTDLLLSKQRTRYAKSGVAPGTGTPLDVIATTAGQAARDRQMILYNGLTAAERRRSLAKRYRMLASEGLRESIAQASMIEETADDRSKGYILEGVGKFATGTYTIGSELGWL